MKSKKRSIKFVLLSAVSILVLTSMMLSIFLGSTNAMLIKGLSKTIGVSAIPDLPWEYFVQDATATTSTAYTSVSKGTYKNFKNFSQEITVGDNPTTTSRAGENVVYQIKIPVSEVGFYTLSFVVDFANSAKSEFYIRSFDTPVGCQVVHHSDIAFGTYTRLSLSPDDDTLGDYNYGVKLPYSTKALLDAYNHYQWKTLAPSRMEQVELSFSVEVGDLTKGYVVWAWDFTGLPQSTQYVLTFSDVKITKNDLADAKKPYFEFMNTQYVNNAIAPTNSTDHNVTLNLKNNTTRTGTGVSTSGYTRYNPARGTYVTNGTYDSLTMQATPLYRAWDNTEKEFVTGSDPYEQSEANLLVFNIPMKNIKKDVSYRVSFDFSVARQGNNNDFPENGTYNISNGLTLNDIIYSSTYNQMFNDTDYGNSLHFQSYLRSGAAELSELSIHTTSGGRGQITMANKQYPAHEVTRYDEIMKIASSSSSSTSCAFSTQSANDAGSHADALNKGITGGANFNSGMGNGVNWLNGIRHIETNGEYKVNWLTFYNTSFTINIPTSEADVTVGEGGYCDNLFWVWAIDALEQTAWFRIKIENVRIEEVVQYGSAIDAKGITIGGAACADYCADGTSTKINSTTTIANTYRNSNGTGQNYQGRGFSNISQAAINTFGTIYDAGNKNIDGNYKISLSGYCVAKGGVEKYVWSADGGKTWYDMVEESPLGTPTSWWLKTFENTDGSQVQKWVDAAIEIPPENTVYKTTFEGTVLWSDDGAITWHDSEKEAIPSEKKVVDYKKDEILISAENRIDACIQGTDGPKTTGDYVDFSSINGATDGIKADFSGGKITADLSAYKYQHNLDIIFAAVPRSNPLLRCEILRVINYNATKNYRTYTLEYESDIEVTTAGNKLNAVFSNSAATKEIYGVDDSTAIFTNMYGVGVDNKVAAAGGYARRTATSHAYKDIRTLYSNMPVKKELTIRGWAIVEGGVEAYMWSADYGKTWTTLSQRGSNVGRATDLGTQYSKWYSSTGSFTGALVTNAYFDFNKKDIDADAVDNGLKIDLSSYVGKVVDIIVVAKPKGSDALCPVSRIDNVAVYGDNGTFYSRVEGVSIDGVSIKSTQRTTHLDGTKFANPQWTMVIKDETYSSLEPYHVRLDQLRFYNNTVNNISKGGKIKITGFAICHGGVAKYKYSFDGGKTFVDEEIPLSNVSDISETVINDAGKLVDASFDVATDAANGYFRKATNDTNDAYLEFSIPDNIFGEKNILVVAESTNGMCYPVLHMKLNIAS